MKELGIWVEVTTLVVPGENDTEEELTSIVRFISDLDTGIPWHVSRFHPNYKYNEGQSTPIETLRKAYSIGKDHGLFYVYIGNVLGESEDTVCPQCGLALIQRSGFYVTKDKLKNSYCSSCGQSISGVFK
jgi:pyruvate formate lyase activating enzyme